MNPEAKCIEAEGLWQRVYSRVEMMLADREASLPRADELDEMTTEQRRAAYAKADADEVNAVRECVHDIVRDAIVVVTGWCSAGHEKTHPDL